MPTVVVRFANGSTLTREYGSHSEAMQYCQKNISYTGGKVKRVEIVEEPTSAQAVWDASWDALSQRRGLEG